MRLIKYFLLSLLLLAGSVTTHAQALGAGKVVKLNQPSYDIVSVAAQTTVEAEYLQTFSNLETNDLPTTVNVTVDYLGFGEVTYTAGVDWDEGDYDSSIELAEYTITGMLTDLPVRVTNTGSLQASIVVTIASFDESGETPAPALYQATGTLVGGTSVTVNWPAHAVNDVGVLLMEQTPDDASITTISGWTYLGEISVAGSGRTRLTVFLRRATSTSESGVNISSTNHISGVIITFRGVTLNPLLLNSIDSYAFSVKTPASTSTSIAGITSNQDGNDILYVATWGVDVGTARYSAESNASLSGLTERVDAGTATGDGGGIGAWTGNKATAGLTGTFTATVASSTLQSYLVIVFKGTNNYSAPSVQASDLLFSGMRKVSWTKSGAGTVVLYNESGTINGSFLPVDHTVYDAGDDLGGGNYVMYRGTASEAEKFERFSFNTTVAIRAFAYNVTGDGPEYNTATATLNPITPTTPVDPAYYLGDAITESERDDAHPENNLRGAAKAYGLKTYEINGYRIVFYVMDNNGSSTIYGATLAKYDQIYMLYQPVESDPRDPAEWTRFEVAGVPWAVLPSDGNVPPSDNWHIGQNWIAGMRIVTDPDEIWIYVSAQGSGITARYNFGRAVCDFTDFPTTAPTVVYDASPLISQATNQDNFQGGDVVYHSGISRYVALIPNRAAFGGGFASNGRSETGEVWLSSDGLAWSKIETDIFAGSPISWGGWILHGNAWVDSGRIHFIGTEGDIFNPRSSDSAPGNTIYKFINNKINEYSFAISLTDVTDLRIENVLYEGDFSSGSFGYSPCSGYIDYGGETHVITNSFNTQGIESGAGQVPIDIRVLTTSPRSGSTVVNRNAYTPGLTRYMRVSRCNVSQAAAAGDTNDTLGDPVPSGAPYCEVTEATGTIHGTPTIFLINAAELPTSSDYFSFPSHTHHTDSVAIKTTFHTNDFTNRGIAEKAGTYMMWLDSDSRLRVRVYRTGGYLEVQTVSTFNTLNCNIFQDVSWAGFVWNNGTLKVAAGCTTDAPVNIITNTGSGGMVQNSNANKLGNVTGITDNIPIITAQTWYEGANATEATWLKCNYN